MLTVSLTEPLLRVFVDMERYRLIATVHGQ